MTEVGENVLSVSVSKIFDSTLGRCTWKQMKQVIGFSVQVQKINDSQCGQPEEKASNPSS